jgi:hypothetical protein
MQAVQFNDEGSVAQIVKLCGARRVTMHYMLGDIAEMILTIGANQHVSVRPGNWIFEAKTPLGFDVSAIFPED